MTKNPKFKIGDTVITSDGNIGKIDYFFENPIGVNTYIVNFKNTLKSSVYSELQLNLCNKEEKLISHAKFKFDIGDTIYHKTEEAEGTILNRFISFDNSLSYIIKCNGCTFLAFENELETWPGKESKNHPEKFWLIVEIPAAEEYQPHKYASLEEAKKAFEKLSVYHRKKSYVIMESVYG